MSTTFIGAKVSKPLTIFTNGFETKRIKRNSKSEIKKSSG
jgi:hypothetical protein